MSQIDENKEVPIWNPITFSEIWKKTSTAKLDKLIPSWFNRREQLQKQGTEYEKFLDRLKRQHAIETGVIEKLYDLKEGITETFIKEGFVESYLQHGDTNVNQSVLMGFLRDQFDALDFVFDVVKNNRQLTKSFILELHQLITSNQETTEAVTSLGQLVEIPLLKGHFKRHENNPKRTDGTKFIYCPPVHVEAEVDQLLYIYNELEIKKEVHPVIIAAWFHHSFAKIHPFQDGNGRISRLLSSLILIKNNLFPLNVNREEKVKYIDSLQNADQGEYQTLIDLFCEIQVRNIELALNWKPDQSSSSYLQVMDLFTKKLQESSSNERKLREVLLNERRREIFDVIKTHLEQTRKDLEEKVLGMASIHLGIAYPGEQNSHYYAGQIIEYAKRHDYYFNRILPKGWFTLQVRLSQAKLYRLIISVHHYGYEDSTIAIGAILEFGEEGKESTNTKQRSGRDNRTWTMIPIDLRPFTLSADLNVSQVEHEIRSFTSDIITITLAHIANEII